jgi:hypothetical protein
VVRGLSPVFLKSWPVIRSVPGWIDHFLDTSKEVDRKIREETINNSDSGFQERADMSRSRPL